MTSNVTYVISIGVVGIAICISGGHSSYYEESSWETRDTRKMEKWSVFIVFHVVGSIDRRTFCLSPFRFDTFPAWEASFPPPRSNPLWPSPPLTSVLQQPPLRQHHSPFTLFLSEILERGKGGRPSLFLPAFPTRLAATLLPLRPPPDAVSAVFLPSSCSRRWVTSTSDFVFSQGGRSKKLRKKRKIDGGGIDPVVGKLAIIFRGLFALAARDGAKGVEEPNIILYSDTELSRPRDKTSKCSLNLQFKTTILFIMLIL